MAVNGRICITDSERARDNRIWSKWETDTRSSIDTSTTYYTLAEHWSIVSEREKERRQRRRRLQPMTTAQPNISNETNDWNEDIFIYWFGECAIFRLAARRTSWRAMMGQNVSRRAWWVRPRPWRHLHSAQPERSKEKRIKSESQQIFFFFASPFCFATTRSDRVLLSLL